MIATVFLPVYENISELYVILINKINLTSKPIACIKNMYAYVIVLSGFISA